MPSGKPKELINEKFPLGPGIFAVEASNGRWMPFKHLIIVVELLMYLVDGKFNRLMIFMPPRHGKSELISKYFLTWFLGSFPDLRIILATHMASFSAKWGRKSKQLLEAYGKKLFVKEMLTETGEHVLVNNEVSLDKNSQASYRWDIAGHEGGLVTGGIGTGLLGEGAHGGILDDPTKGFKKANSPTHQQELNDWYYTEYKTRLDKDLFTGRYPWMIYIAQRLNKKDLAGQILYGFEDEDPGEPHIDAREALNILRSGGNIPMGTWVVLNLPALAEDNDLLGRNVGEALCPLIMNEEDLAQIKKDMGSFRFEAIYQGNPQEREGSIFKRVWFLNERGEFLSHIILSNKKLPEVRNEIGYWDFGSSGESGDATAYLKSWWDGEYLTFTDYFEEKLTAKGVIQTFERKVVKNGSKVLEILEQEPGSASKNLKASFKSKESMANIPMRLDKVSESKADRAFDLEVLSEDGKVRMVNAWWNRKLVNYLIEFTGEDGNEDHIPDCATGSARYWKSKRTVLKPRRRRKG